jgi:hypothetical protein
MNALSAVLLSERYPSNRHRERDVSTKYFLLAGLWFGSCYYCYAMGWINGDTAANIKAASHFSAPRT